MEKEGEFEIYWVGTTKMYKCNRYWSTGHKCQFDTYDYAALIQHVSDPHSESGKRIRVKKQKRVSASVLGADGTPAVIEESDDVSRARFKEE